MLIVPILHVYCLTKITDALLLRYTMLTLDLRNWQSVTVLSRRLLLLTYLSQGGPGEAVNFFFVLFSLFICSCSLLPVPCTLSFTRALLHVSSLLHDDFQRTNAPRIVVVAIVDGNKKNCRDSTFNERDFVSPATVPMASDWLAAWRPLLVPLYVVLGNCNPFRGDGPSPESLAARLVETYARTE